MSEMNLSQHNQLFVRQAHELAELLGFETRNKYVILDESHRQIGFAAEQQKGLFGFLFRQFLGHWRKFDIHFFDNSRQLFMKAHHPFRFFFQRLEILNIQGQKIGAIQQRFAIFSKRFDVENDRGMTILQVSSPLWKFWTFTLTHNGRKMAEIKKKWSGFLSEGFTDKDNFRVDFSAPSLTENERRLILAAALFVDLQYFEAKAD